MQSPCQQSTADGWVVTRVPGGCSELSWATAGNNQMGWDGQGRTGVPGPEVSLYTVATGFVLAPTPEHCLAMQGKQRSGKARKVAWALLMPSLPEPPRPWLEDKDTWRGSKDLCRGCAMERAQAEPPGHPRNGGGTSGSQGRAALPGPWGLRHSSSAEAKGTQGKRNTRVGSMAQVTESSVLEGTQKDHRV